MADTESILQLGIEAARAGDKEEARNLFRLLTRETPEDPQAWLWLAGVAEDREEKRAALEHATNLDPSNELARQGLAALGGPTKAAAAAPPPPAQPSADDFDFDFSAAPIADTPPPPAARTPEPARTRELTPEEELAMSLDSLGSLSTTYNERSKSSSDSAIDFNIPDFGDGDDEVDLNAYMNRERVDMSTIQVSAEEAKKPVRKQISKGGVSDEVKARLKEKKPKAPGAARASGGWLPMLGIALLAFIVIWGLWYFVIRDKGPVAEGTATPTIAGVAQGSAIPTDGTLPTLQPGGGIDNPTPSTPGDGTQQPGDATQPPVEQPTQPSFNPAADPTLGSVQPNILPGDGSVPVVVDNWYFNYGGTSGIADGNVIGIQPQGRWLIVGPLMFDATAEGRTLPGDLLVLKDAQGRVYRPNPDASESFVNAYPGSYPINQKQPVPIGVNFSMPLLFDVAPDATDLVLFSPQDLNQGYYVRANAN